MVSRKHGNRRVITFAKLLDLALVLFLSAPVYAQIVGATVSGTVVDTSRAVIAGEINGRSRSAWNRGMIMWGRPDGMPPKRVPIVSTGSFSKTTSAVPANSATMYPGTRFTKRMKIKITMRADTPRLVSNGENV